MDGRRHPAVWSDRDGDLVGNSHAGSPRRDDLDYAPISFSIPLAAELDNAHVIKISPTTTPIPAGCENAAHSGTASISNPEAAPGFLCVYAGTFSPKGTLTSIYKPQGVGELIEGASKAGAVLLLEAEVGDVPGVEFVGGFGTFAVTGM